MGDKLKAGVLLACWLLESALWMWAIILMIKGADRE